MNHLVSHQVSQRSSSLRNAKGHQKGIETLSSTVDIIEEVKQGRMVVLLDDEGQDTEGCLMMAAQHVRPADINFMSKFARGLIGLTLSKERGKQLNLSRMVVCNDARVSTNLTVSIGAAQGISTGISAADRAHTIQTAVHVNARPNDIVSPGHVFPLIAKAGGVLVRAGHTEAGCDIARLAGLDASAVICEILQGNGEMARLPELLKFATDFDLKIGTIKDLINYRSQKECLVKRIADRVIETAYGQFRLIAYKASMANELHLALVKGHIVKDRSILVRMHESLSVMDLLDYGDKRFQWTLPKAMRMINEADRGVIVMLRREEKSEDVINAINSTDYSANKHLTLKDYGVSAQILRDLGVLNMRLMGEPRKMPDLGVFGLNLTDFVEL